MAAAAPASAHDPNHVYLDESGNPCWIHSNDPSAFHWVLADLGSQKCLTTFASDADWIYSYDSSTGRYIQSSNAVVCSSTDGCGPESTPGPPPECASLTDHEYALWSAYVDWSNGYLDAGPDLTDAEYDLYLACWGWWF